MKKLLNVLATFSIVTSPVFSVVACGTKLENKPKKPEEPKEDLNE